MKVYLLIFASLFCRLAVLAQESELSLNLYFDSYYSAYTDDLPLNEFQQFTTVSPRDGLIGINAIQAGLRYDHSLIRGALTLQFGDIAKATWSEEFENLQEGWAGIRIIDGLWLDAGFFTTHVGTESFLPKNNMLSSTTFATYIGPFYQAGARVSWEGSERFSAAFHVINGYNQFLDDNRAKSVGIAFTYQLKENLALTYTNMLGRESAEDAPRKQYLSYHNVYARWTTADWDVLAGGDVASQTNSSLDDPEKSAYMYNFLVTIRYSLTEQVGLTGRIETYQDPDGFLSGTFNTSQELTGLRMTGYTGGLEYAPVPWSFLRAETRYVHNSDGIDIYTDDESMTNDRWEFMITLGLYLDEFSLLRQPDPK